MLGRISKHLGAYLVSGEYDKSHRTDEKTILYLLSESSRLSPGSQKTCRRAWNLIQILQRHRHHEPIDHVDEVHEVIASLGVVVGDFLKSFESAKG